MKKTALKTVEHQMLTKKDGISLRVLSAILSDTIKKTNCIIAPRERWASLVSKYMGWTRMECSFRRSYYLFSWFVWFGHLSQKCYSYSADPSIHPAIFNTNLGLGCERRSSISNKDQTSLTLATTSSSSGGIPRRFQGSREISSSGPPPSGMCLEHLSQCGWAVALL